MFKSMLGGDDASFPFEIVSDGGQRESTVVVPAWRQSVYMVERNATSNGKPYGGLVATLMDGYAPVNAELTLPFNVYTFSRCEQIRSSPGIQSVSERSPLRRAISVPKRMIADIIRGRRSLPVPLCQHCPYVMGMLWTS